MGNPTCNVNFYLHHSQLGRGKDGQRPHVEA